MKILITGGAGHIGRPTAERFIQHGWDVRVIELEAGAEIPGAEVVRCDIMNYDDLRQQMCGCQAVVHLAAIRSPLLAPGHTVFQVNVAGTFNVFDAAAAEGIHRVVQASSINAFGCAWSLFDISPQYFPIDEAHPSFTTDPYSYSKEVVEDIGRYYWRREGISSVALRFPWVYSAEFAGSDYRQRRHSARQVIEELSALSESERLARLAEARQRTLDYRKQRPLEFQDPMPKLPSRKDTSDQLYYAYMFDRFNFWASVDVRDAAQALEKGVTAQYEGAHTLFINNRRNWLSYDSRTLVHFFFPDVSESNIVLSGSASLVSIEKAHTLIGFEPEYSPEEPG